MKILKVPSKKPWWYGKPFECQCCGWTVELEEADQFKVASASLVSASLPCRSCGATITIENSPKQEARKPLFGKKKSENTPSTD